MSWKLEFYGEILHLTTLWWAAMPAILHHESSISKLNALYPYCLLHIAYFVCILSVALFPMPAILHHPSSISKLNAQYPYCPLPILPIDLLPLPAILHHASPSAQYQSWMLYYFEGDKCGRYFCILLKILLS